MSRGVAGCLLRTVRHALSSRDAQPIRGAGFTVGHCDGRFHHALPRLLRDGLRGWGVVQYQRHSCLRKLEVLGQHSYRPAHLHFLITAPGFQKLVTQIYFEDDPYLTTDCCSAVKNDLVVPVSKAEIDGESYHLVKFDFTLQPQ